MHIPAIKWPTELHDAGPTSDPSIMLVGAAKIGSIKYEVTAIRIDKCRANPFFREDLDEETYEIMMDETLDIVDLLMNSGDRALLPLDGGLYLLWMTPTDIE